MPDNAHLMLFALAALAVTASPGPAMLLVTSRSATQGRIAGLATWAGIATGNYFYALAAAFGLSQLFLAAPVAYDSLRVAGAAYFLYLAGEAFTSSAEARVTRQNQRKHSVYAMFRQGLLTNLLNPIVLIFIFAIFPQFVEPEAGSVAIQIMIFASVLNAIGFFIYGGTILVSSRIGGLLSGRNRIKNLSPYVLGSVFTGFAVKLALS